MQAVRLTPTKSLLVFNSKAKRDGGLTDADVTGCIWSFVEVSVAIVCANLQSYRPLLLWCISAVEGERQEEGSSVDETNPFPPMGSDRWEKDEPSTNVSTISWPSQSTDAASGTSEPVMIA